MSEGLFGIHGAALEIRSQRMGVLGSNIANAATPGYKARDVDFASALQARLGGAAADRATDAAIQYRIPTMASLDGNTVEMSTEQAALRARRRHRDAQFPARAGRNRHPRDPGRMTMSGPTSFFQVGHRAMSAQFVRMNTAASTSPMPADRRQRGRGLPAHAHRSNRNSTGPGLSSVRVGGVVREDVAAIRRHDPGHPLADENGDVWEAPVDENAEMVEMLEARASTATWSKRCRPPSNSCSKR